MRCFSQPWLDSMRYWFNIVLYGSPDLSVTAPLLNACLGNRFCIFLGKFDTKDWLALCKWGIPHLSLRRLYSQAESRGTDLPPCIPIVRFIDKRCQPLCQPLTAAARFTAWLPVSGLQEEKGLGTPLRFQLLYIPWFLVRFPEIIWIGRVCLVGRYKERRGGKLSPKLKYI